jgi:hypothetical protein
MTKPTEIFIPQDDRTRVATVHMYEAERKRSVKASEAMLYALSDAANVFQLLGEGFASGHFSRGDAGVISLATICAAHFKTLAENEGEELQRLAMNLERPAHVEGQEEQPK